MQDLKDIIALISRKRIDNIQILTSSNRLPTKQMMLYDIIRQNNSYTEDQAISYLYQNKPNSSAFKKVKTRLYQKVLNTCLFLDFGSQVTDLRQKSILTILRTYVLMKILAFFGCRDAGMNLAHKNYQICNKYEISELGSLISKELMKHFAYIAPDKKNYEYYLKECRKWSLIVQQEIEIEILYSRISYLAGTIKNTKLLRKEVDYHSSISKLTQIINQDQLTYRLLFMSFTLLSYLYSLYEEFEACIKTCDKGIEKLKRKNFSSNKTTFLLTVDKIIALIRLARTEDAKKITQETIRLTQKGTLNYFAASKYILLINSLEKDWNSFCLNSIAIFGDNELKRNQREYQLWNIRFAFAAFLIQLNKYKPTKNINFRLYKFLNDVPIFVKDKSGVNITILIIQLLFLLKDKKYTKIEERLGSLSQYSHRYLRDDENLRANCLIKMLLKLPEAEYHPLRVKRYVSRYEKKLASKPYEVNEQNLDVEIIPFDILWELVLELLDNNLKQKKKRGRAIKKDV